MLFGYEKGSFTGAHAAHAGKFEQAQGGTLLLDEITEMPLALQAKLLRVLQEREVERIGGSAPMRARRARARDHQPPAARRSRPPAASAKTSTTASTFSPSRSRRCASAATTSCRWPRTCCSSARAPAQRIPALSADAAHLLLTYTWPGNVRELDNLLQRALVLVEGSVIEAEHILFEKQPTRLDARRDRRRRRCADTLQRAERDVILEALRAAHGSRREVAEKLGISPRTLRYKLARIRNAGIDVPAA